MYRMILQIRRIKILKNDAIDKVKLFGISINLNVSTNGNKEIYCPRSPDIFGVLKLKNLFPVKSKRRPERKDAHRKPLPPDRLLMSQAEFLPIVTG